MQYIGNKQSLVQNIYDIMQKNNISGKIFLDVFAGTQSVGRFFKDKGYCVYSNDWQYYSYVLGKAYIENNKPETFEKICDYLNIERSYEKVLDYLNNISPLKGFVYNNFCPGGTADKEYQRLYFLDENGQKFDAIRTKIEEWKQQDLLSENEYFILLATLLESVDKVSNTTSVYGAFLKSFKHSSAKIFDLKPLTFTYNNQLNKSFCLSANNFAKTVQGDIAYLDPPYNSRQYATNYHVLETMARYDNPVLYGKTGTREYSSQKSDFCSKPKVKSALDELVRELIKSGVKYIVMSYNNEGILPEPEIEETLRKYGEITKEEINYKRFKADKETEKRRYKTNRVKELVYILKISHP